MKTFILIQLFLGAWQNFFTGTIYYAFRYFALWTHNATMLRTFTPDVEFLQRICLGSLLGVLPLLLWLGARSARRRCLRRRIVTAAQT